MQLLASFLLADDIAFAYAWFSDILLRASLVSLDLVSLSSYEAMSHFDLMLIMAYCLFESVLP